MVYAPRLRASFHLDLGTAPSLRCQHFSVNLRSFFLKDDFIAHQKVKSDVLLPAEAPGHVYKEKKSRGVCVLAV